MKERWALRRQQSGSVTTEFVVITPLLLLLIMSIFQFAMWQHAIHVAETAALDGARSASLDGGTDANGKTQANQLLNEFGSGVIVDPVVTVSRDAETVTVSIVGTSQAVVPGVHLPVRAASRSSIERFVPPNAAS